MDAKRLNKPIFIDIYTTWCGPCKLMDKQVFNNRSVSTVLNRDFISFKLDAEKGEGIEFVKQFKVDAFPTSLYFSSNGKIIHRVEGYTNTENFLKETKKAYMLYKDSLGSSNLEKEFDAGRRDTYFLIKFLSSTGVNKKPNNNALDIYLKSIPQDQWSTEENLQLILSNMTSLKSTAFNFMLRQVPLLIKSDSKSLRDIGIAARMQQFHIVNQTLEKAISSKDETLLGDCINYELRIYKTMSNQRSVDSLQLSNEKRLYFYEKTKQFFKYKPLALTEANRLLSLKVDSIKLMDSRFYKQFLANISVVADSTKQTRAFKNRAEKMQHIESDIIAAKLNDLAKTFYEHVFESKDLSFALLLSKKSLQYNRTAKYLETASKILNKLGNKEEATVLLNEAISIEKEQGRDAKHFVELLNDLELSQK